MTSFIYYQIFFIAASYKWEIIVSSVIHSMTYSNEWNIVQFCTLYLFHEEFIEFVIIYNIDNTSTPVLTFAIEYCLQRYYLKISVKK